MTLGGKRWGLEIDHWYVSNVCVQRGTSQLSDVPHSSSATYGCADADSETLGILKDNQRYSGKVWHHPHFQFPR
jgi:hypothetical protein